MFTASILDAAGGMNNNGMNTSISLVPMAFRLVSPMPMEFMYGKQETQNVDSQRVIKFMINEAQEESLFKSCPVPDNALP